MTYAFVQDIASSWDRYEHLRAALTGPPPDGLILHLAGPTDEGFRIIGVWESERAWRRFQRENLQPALAARRMVDLMAKMITRGPLPEDERVEKIPPRLIIRESA